MNNPKDFPVQIYLEVGTTKTFACAIQWPGWCRSGRDEKAAIEALLAYTGRYAKIVSTAGLAFELPRSIEDFAILERIKGNYATNFGVPDLPIPSDNTALSEAHIDRFSKILKACWLVFDQTARSAEGKELRKGPRGGGRELEGIINHVARAEKGYLRHLGWDGQLPDERDIRHWMDHVHIEILEGILAANRGEYPPVGPHGGKHWPVAYFIRRLAWHVVDHAWEIEDRIISD